jgi:ATP-dependent protease ClpP protease subunit
VPEPVPTYRFWGSKKPPSNRSEFWSVTNETPTPGGGSKTATLRIHGPIDSWGGAFGISAQDVAGALDNLPADTEEIRVRINSPGGDAWEGMNILNMLRAHDARFVAVVDGLAASAASFIAAGADDTVMSPGSQLMVHDAAGLSLGQAKDMRKMAEALDSVSNSIASVYAAATGGTTEDWRTVMVEETWYTADEAVTAGLAARVEVVPDAKSKVARDGKPESTGDQPENRFDLSIFNHAGRSDAPAPHIPPSAPRSGQPNTEGGSAVAFSDEQITNLRAKLQLPETADEAAILAAVNAVVDESLEERPPPRQHRPAPPTAATQPAPAAAPEAPVAAGPGPWSSTRRPGRPRGEHQAPRGRRRQAAPRGARPGHRPGHPGREVPAGPRRALEAPVGRRPRGHPSGHRRPDPERRPRRRRWASSAPARTPSTRSSPTSSRPTPKGV